MAALNERGLAVLWDRVKGYVEWYVSRHSAEMQGVPVATTQRTGVVMPDGETITIDANGVISIVAEDAEGVGF